MLVYGSPKRSCYYRANQRKQHTEKSADQEVCIGDLRGLSRVQSRTQLDGAEGDHHLRITMNKRLYNTSRSRMPLKIAAQSHAFPSLWSKIVIQRYKQYKAYHFLDNKDNQRQSVLHEQCNSLFVRLFVPYHFHDSFLQRTIFLNQQMPAAFPNLASVLGVDYTDFLITGVM